MVAKPMSYVVQQLNYRFLHEYRMIFHQPFSFSCIFQNEKNSVEAAATTLSHTRWMCAMYVLSLMAGIRPNDTSHEAYTSKACTHIKQERKRPNDTKRNGTKSETHDENLKIVVKFKLNGFSCILSSLGIKLIKE